MSVHLLRLDPFTWVHVADMLGWEELSSLLYPAFTPFLFQMVSVANDHESGWLMEVVCVCECLCVYMCVYV